MIDTGLRGRVVLLTGGNGGIGAATARALAAEGAAVFMTTFGSPPADDLVAAIRQQDRRSGAVGRPTAFFAPDRRLGAVGRLRPAGGIGGRRSFQVEITPGRSLPVCCRHHLSRLGRLTINLQSSTMLVFERLSPETCYGYASTDQ